MNNWPHPAPNPGDSDRRITAIGKNPSSRKWISGNSSTSDHVTVTCRGNPLANPTAGLRAMNPAIRLNASGVSRTSASTNTINSCDARSDRR